ncbi:hypothetical protein L484_022099 [Morus notabilis]|uniref:Uncharacterized protein n=2 Tax=Morus notabilis TaxID=981085 RepID=W9QN98_9ROSA|nr:hypothetical protein L484_022099 [Morus notabilis]
MLGVEENDDEEPIVKPKKKISNTLSSENQTKLIKTNLSSKNQTNPLKTQNLSTKNQTKISSTKKTNSTKTTTLLSSNASSTKIELKKLNSTSKIKKLNSTSSSKTFNSTKLSTKKILDPISPKNTTTTTTKKTQNLKAQKSAEKKPMKSEASSWVDLEDETDLVSEFSDLPMKFQKSLIPDLEKISTTSKAYLNQANKQITKGFKPIVGNKYAPTIASLVSFAFILIPLLLVSLIFNRIKAYFSLQKLLIFIQVYLSIYFAILCLSSLVTGLEPLKFFYATSQSTYICLQVLQTLGYVLYLLLLLMYLILVFSTDCGLGSKMLGLAQTFVGFAVGLHYYVAVFHRVVLRQPPKTNWKVHGIYATCFFVICLCARAERRKKAYLEDGGEEGKKN